MKKAEFFMAIIMLFVISGSSAAASADIPVLPPAEEIVTHIVLEGVTETAAGDAHGQATNWPPQSERRNLCDARNSMYAWPCAKSYQDPENRLSRLCIQYVVCSAQQNRNIHLLGSRAS